MVVVALFLIEVFSHFHLRMPRKPPSTGELHWVRGDPFVPSPDQAVSGAGRDVRELVQQQAQVWRVVCIGDWGLADQVGGEAGGGNPEHDKSLLQVHWEIQHVSVRFVGMRRHCVHEHLMQNIPKVVLLLCCCEWGVTPIICGNPWACHNVCCILWDLTTTSSLSHVVCMSDVFQGMLVTQTGSRKRCIVPHPNAVCSSIHQLVEGVV